MISAVMPFLFLKMRNKLMSIAQGKEMLFFCCFHCERVFSFAGYDIVIIILVAMKSEKAHSIKCDTA